MFVVLGMIHWTGMMHSLCLPIPDLIDANILLMPLGCAPNCMVSKVAETTPSALWTRHCVRQQLQIDAHTHAHTQTPNDREGNVMICCSEDAKETAELRTHRPGVR